MALGVKHLDQGAEISRYKTTLSSTKYDALRVMPKAVPPRSTKDPAAWSSL